jgi:hypothetical protein
MEENKTKFGAAEVNDPEQFAALLNKQFAKYNDLLSGTSTKGEVKQMYADLVVENKEILSKVAATGDEMAKLKKQLEDANNSLIAQGETITKFKNVLSNDNHKETLGDAITRKITKENVLKDLIDGKTASSRFEIETKDVAFTGTYGSGAAQQSYMPFQIPQMPPMENSDVRLILPTGTINSEKLSFPQERALSLTDATDTKTENGALGESTMGFTMGTANAKRMGAYIEVSRTALKNSAWLGSYINNRLIAMLIKTLNLQVIKGAGADQDINGLYNNANAFDASTNFSGVSSNPSIFDVIRAAMADMNSSYFVNANSVLLNPTDAAIAAIAKNTIADYIDPASFLQRNNVGYTGNWGLRNIETGNITKNTLLVAAIQQAYMELLFNGPIEVIASDSHASNFVSDLVTIKVQVQAMLPIYNANALMKVTSVSGAITEMTTE